MSTKEVIFGFILLAITGGGLVGYIVYNVDAAALPDATPTHEISWAVTMKNDDPTITPLPNSLIDIETTPGSVIFVGGMNIVVPANVHRATIWTRP